jgi:hypothetical protein
MKTLKMTIGVVLAVVWGMVFLAMPAQAFMNDGNFAQDGRNNGEFNSKGNAEGRGTANFTMSFSGSGTTKGNMDANGSTQNMFDSKSYEYRPYYYGNPNYEFPAKETK